jgi:UDP-N-acetylmuramoyl-L-alanyl-D-glutamate--2,6-diaminopimelate ligase
VVEPRGRARVRWHDLVDGLDGAELSGDPSVEVTGLTHDSRRVTPGACFACIPGATADGHAFASAAVAAGAVALLTERPLGLGPSLGVAEARVPSVRIALGPLAARLHGHPSAAMCCLGVTGTNGKTTTTFLLVAIADAAGERTAVIGTVGARLGAEVVVPDAVAAAHTTPEADDLQALLAHMRDAGARVVAMEVSSHAIDQHRVDGTTFAAVCFTNLTHEHLDYHGTLDAYFAAKAALFDTRFTPAAAVNVDDEHGRLLAARLVEPRPTERGTPDVCTFGTAPDAMVRATDVRLGPAGNSFVLTDTRTGATAPVASPLVGVFNVSNALGAAATALLAGFAFDTVVAGLVAPVVVPGRMERVDAGQPFGVLVDYAHTPDALARALDAARTAARAVAPDARVVVVFGCGGDRDRAKRPLMGAAAGEGAEVVVLTTDNPRSEDPQAIADAAVEGLRATTAEVVVELDRRAAIATALRAARPGDIVVIAGKGHESGQTAAGETRPFDDRLVAREELGSLGWA